MKNKLLLLGFFLLSSSVFLFSQNNFTIHGDFEINAQTYKKDSLIDAPNVPEKMLYNAYSNIIIQNKNFSAGVRFESYQNALLGYDRRYNGEGIPFRYAKYADTLLTVTIGNFYEQFGNGLVLRSFEDKALGYDNAFDGIQIKLHPYRGVYFKALSGKQRFFWTKGPGIVRGADFQFNINSFFEKQSKANLIFGGSFVSKYQKDENPIYVLPENVAAFAGRINFIYGFLNLNAEFAYKINDPSADNKYIYKPGNATYISLTYAKPGIGFILNLDRYDNMSFRSDLNANLNNLSINSLPAITQTHLFSLEEIYPYSVQPLGEMGISAELFYKIKKKTTLGGRYGTFFTINYARIYSINKTPLFDGTGYSSDFFKLGKNLFYQDFDISMKKKISHKFSFSLNYMNLIYNKDFVQGLVGYGTVYANIGIIESTYKINRKNSLRTELQLLLSKQDLGNFAMAFAEYSVSPHWFFSAFDEYNYSNTHITKNVHYYDFAISYLQNSTRLSISYGRHREGIICVGGVCRNVPASNGFSFGISTSF